MNPTIAGGLLIPSKTATAENMEEGNQPMSDDPEQFIPEDEAEILQPEPHPAPAPEPQPEPLQQQPPLTKGALATLGMDALDRNRVGQVKVSAMAGGVAFATAIEVMEFSKLMAVAQTAVPKHLRNNPGMCLAVTFQAVEWHMSPFAVANKSYVVNDRIAYESQLVHAVIEARAPLRERLDCTYEGEGPERTCTVIGKFLDGTERSYTTPKLKDIRVKNSPLWKDDQDQQQFYYGSRSWSRKWCPDVLLGIYTREEMAALPQENMTTDHALRERIQGTKEGAEGHRNGHAESELANVAADRGGIAPAGAGTIKPATQTKAKAAPKAAKKKTPDKKPAQKEPDIKATKPTAAQKAAAAKTAASAAADRAQATSDKNKAKQKPEPAPAPKVPTEPKSEAEYQVYCIDWISKVADPDKALDRWGAERDMRERCGVRTNMRNDLRFRIETKHGV